MAPVEQLALVQCSFYALLLTYIIIVYYCDSLGVLLHYRPLGQCNDITKGRKFQLTVGSCVLTEFIMQRYDITKGREEVP